MHRISRISKRSQAAMEFLLSYGWMIFLAMVALALLFSYGILDTSVILPDQADAGKAVTVKDFTVNENSVTFVFDNVAGKPLYNFSVTVKGCNHGAGASSDPIRLGKDGKATVTVACPNAGPAFSTFKSDLEVHYAERMVGTTSISASSSTGGGDPGTYTSIIEIGLLKTKIKPAEPLEAGCDVELTACGYTDWELGKTYCLVNDVTSHAGTCFTISDATNIIFDGKNHIIAKNRSIEVINDDGEGIIVDSGSTITIKNVNVTNYRCGSGECENSGIELRDTNNVVLDNISAYSNGVGILVSQNSNGIIIGNSTSLRNVNFDFVCNDSSVTGTENVFNSIINCSTGWPSRGIDYNPDMSVCAYSLTSCYDDDNEGFWHSGVFCLDANISSWNDGDCFNINANNVVFNGNGHTIGGKDTNEYFGIHLDHVYNNYVLNVSSNGFGGGGIRIEGEGSNELRNITVKNNIWNGDGFLGYGIYIDHSDDNIIRNVVASNNIWSYGIYVESSSGNTLTNITASSNGNMGIYLIGSVDNILRNITANSNDIGVAVYDTSTSNDLINITANSNTNYGLYLWSSSNNNIYNVSVSNNAYGFMIDATNNNFIRCNANSNQVGFSFEEATGNYLENVTANSNSDTGFKFGIGSDSNVVVNSTFNYNSGNGIWLIGSLSNSFNGVTAGGNSNWDFVCGGNTAQGTDNNFNKVSPCEDGWPVLNDNYGYAFGCDVLISSCADDDEPGFWNLHQKTCLVANINEMSGELEEDCLHIDVGGILDGLGHKIENNGYTVTGITINDGIIMQINNITVRYFTNGIKSIDRDFWYTINNSVICNNTENDILIASSTGTIDGHDNYISNIYGTYENNLQNNHSCLQNDVGDFCMHNGDCITGKCYVGESDYICTNGLFDQPCDDNLDCEDYFVCESGGCQPES